MNEKNKKIIRSVAVISLFIFWIVLLYNIPPTKIIEFIGTNNSYILSIIFGFMGGTSILFPFPYYIAAFTFGSGGLNPLLIGILTGTGVALGDSTSYLVGYSGREILSEKLNKYFKIIYAWCTQKPKWMMPLFLYIYSSVMPLPNDVIVMPLGLVRYPYFKMIVPMWLGSITFNTAIALAGFYGFSYVF